jgi:hypothetical protein
MSIQLLQKGRRYAIPPLVKAGIGTGFLFSLLIVLYDWLSWDAGFVVKSYPIGMILLVSIPCGIALHALRLLRENLSPIDQPSEWRKSLNLDD